MPRARARRRRAALREFRLTLWAGLLLGLLVFQGVRLWVDAPPAGYPDAPIEAQPPDPYAESRRSSEILEGQEAPPPPLSRGAPPPAGERFSPAAVRVIDGDTFDLAGERIRVADIDTPELRGRCDSETRLAARATARMRVLLDAGPFELHPVGWRDEDRYGRKLRIVTRGGRSLGDMLVAEGLARTWTGRRQPWC